MLDRERFETLCAEHMEKQFGRVRKMRELHTGEWIDRDYYVRHLMETVLRIRLNNEVATYALYQVGSKDDVLAGAMSRYLYEEFGHETMFTRDLDAFGVSVDELNATPEFPSTAKLMGYLQLLAHRDGPAPSVTWDWFVEWYQERYNPIIVGKAGREFGDQLVDGWQKHIEFDESHEHDDLMWTVVSRAVEGWSSPERAEAYLVHYIDMIGDYFQELYDATVGARLAGAERAPVGAGAKG
jgi:heme oxygenase-like protein